MSPGAETMPCARLLLSSVAPPWQHAVARRQGLTANDVLTFLDPAPGVDVDFDTARSTHGEVALAYAWAQARDVTIARLGLIANLSRPWMLATVGWHVTGCSLGGQCSVEFVPSWTHSSDRHRDVLPEPVNRRLQWQLATSGLDHAHVATTAHGQLAENYVAFPDEPVIELLVTTATAVWQCRERRPD